MILDYGDNIARHGPIDLPDDTEVKLTTCSYCSNVFSRAVICCPSCGWVIPPKQREQWAEQEERERTMHEAKAKAGALLNEPRWLTVDGVSTRLHRKAGKPDSVRVEYFCGLTIVKEWLLLDHGSYGSTKARKWLLDRGLTPYESTADMLEANIASDIKAATNRLMVRYSGKYLEIAAHEIRAPGGNLKII